MDWRWRVWCGIEWLQRNYSATIWSQPLSPCSGNSGCMPSQGSTQWLKMCCPDKAWKQKEESRGGWWFFSDYITWPKHPLQRAFLFVQSSLQLGVRTRKIRSTLEINFSSLCGIFQSGYSCLTSPTQMILWLTATSMWLLPINNLREITFCFKKKKQKPYRLLM